MRIGKSLLVVACGLMALPAAAEKKRAQPEVSTIAATAHPASPVRRTDAAMFGGGFSPEVAANLLDRVCQPASERNDSISDIAEKAGLKAVESPVSVRWALAEGARVWAADTVDSRLYVYAYGAGLKTCGAVIARPLPGVIAERVRVAMSADGRGYQLDSEQTLGAGVKFVRMKSATGRFLDLLEYPATADAPGLLKIELLPR